MDNFRGKQSQTDDSWNIAVIFANGSGKFMDIGKLTTVNQCLPTKRQCKEDFPNNLNNPDHFLPWNQGKKHEAWKGFASYAVRLCFIRRQAYFMIRRIVSCTIGVLYKKPFQRTHCFALFHNMKQFPASFIMPGQAISFRYETHVIKKWKWE